MNKLPWPVLIIIAAVWLAAPPFAIAQAEDESVARAVLFYSPTCPHCHEVIENTLIPLVDKYDDQLQILAIDVTQPSGQQLYLAAIERYQIQQQGVPTLIVGEIVLIGGLDIPRQFPALVEVGLAAEGIDWPDLPGLAELLPTATPATSTSTPTVQTPTPLPSSPTPTLLATATLSPTLTATTVPPAISTPMPQPIATAPPALLSVDSELLPPPEIGSAVSPPHPAGFALAGGVLVAMLAVLGYAAWRIIPTLPYLFRSSQRQISRVRTWAAPVLALLGLGVAIYLAYVEITHVEAICGPIGECNIVQSSPYARIFGVPIALLGVLFYLGVGFLWIGQKYLPGRWAGLGATALLGLTLAGLLFSIYLTWLELFVIQAICAWCVSSAVITALLLLQVIWPVTHHPDGRQAAV